MLRFRNHVLSALRAAAYPFRRLRLSTIAATSPAQFITEDYLVATCGLTPAQARKASKYLPHVKSPSNPDAVRALLADIGLGEAAVAAAISRFPRLLCSRVDKTLAPRLAQLRDVGLSPPQVCRLITIIPSIFVHPVAIYRLAFYVSFVGSYDKVHAALRRNPRLLGQNLENVVKPNLAFLQQCGLTPCDVVKAFVAVPQLFTSKPERVKEIVARAEKLGITRQSGMFRQALQAVYRLSPGTITTKLDFLKRAMGCSEAELRIMVCKSTAVLQISEGNVGGTLEFLKVEVGLEAQYIIHRPAMLVYSLQTRLMPRHYVIKLLKAKGLVKKDVDFYKAVSLTEEKFVEKFIDHFKKSVPGLADAYAAACAGKTTPGTNCEDLEIGMEMLKHFPTKRKLVKNTRSCSVTRYRIMSYMEPQWIEKADFIKYLIPHVWDW